MFIYQVGYSSYEESPRYLLQSDLEYTENQFNDLVSDCFANVYKNKSDKQNVDYSVDNLLSEVIQYLKNNFGFIDFVPKCTFMPFGWASVSDSEHWKQKTSNDIELTLIRKKINCL